MSVHRLTSENFQVVGHQKKTLNMNMPGVVLVFFKMDGCPGCNAFEPNFLQLAREEKSINYAVVNLTESREVVAMSRKTSTPIQTVPFIILYINGNPFAKYTGKKNTVSLRSFITKALSQAPSIQNQQPRGGFMPEQNYPPGYHQQQMGPHQGPAGYTPPPSQDGKVYMPEIGKKPQLQGIVKGDGVSQYAQLGDVEEDDEEKLLIPGQVTPHNVPWESSYRRVGSVD